MPVAITLQVTAETAQALRDAVVAQSEGGSRSLPVPSAVQLVRDLGVELQPLHPGTSDSELQRFFIVTMEDGERVNQVLESLRECHGIEAAYVKPPDELP